MLSSKYAVKGSRKLIFIKNQEARGGLDYGIKALIFP